MNRRDFVAATAALSAAPLHAAAHEAAPRQDDPRQYIELLIYHTQPYGPNRNRVADFYRDVALPAYERMGIGPVGVFTVQYGPTSPSLFVLVPHDTLASTVETPARLLADPEVRSAGQEFLFTPLGDPAYVRYERRLMRAFSGMPRLEAAADLLGDDRVFEWRVYESHSRVAGQKKIDMFNIGGEIPIFHNTGLRPVFFGETIFGPDMPNLTYMLVFPDLAERDAAWGRFRDDPDWHELSGDEQYRDTVSNITDFILRPTGFSQI